MPKLKVAVVGTGLIATAKHLPALKNLAKIVDLVAICDVNAEQAQKVAADFGGPKTYTDLATMLERERPDIVDICTPPKLHASMALESIQRGAHVLIEKPMCQTVEECDAVIAAAVQHGKQVCVAHSDLFYPSFAKARELVAANAIGTLRGMRIHLSTPVDYITSKPDHWAHKLPGGVFGESGPHVVYMALAFLERVTRTTVVARKVLPEFPWSPFEDYRLEIEGEKATCSVSMIYTTNQWGAEVEIWGNDGSLRMDLENQTLIHRDRQNLRMVPIGLGAIGEAVQILSSGWSTAFDMLTKRYTQTHQELIRAFAAAIIEGKPSPIPPEQGRESIRVMQMITAQLQR